MSLAVMFDCCAAATVGQRRSSEGQPPNERCLNRFDQMQNQPFFAIGPSLWPTFVDDDDDDDYLHIPLSLLQSGCPSPSELAVAVPWSVRRPP